jgi:hypothetical protein
MKGFGILVFALSLSFSSMYSASDVRISFIDPGINQVILTNLGDASVNVAGHWLCNFPNYDQILNLTILSGSTSLSPGASVTIEWDGMPGADGECGYYSTNSFMSSAAIVDYVEWGSAGHTREPVAVAAGVWNAGEFVADNQPHSFIGSAGDYGVAFWAAAAENVRITKVILEYGLTELTNMGTLEQDISGWYLCQFPQYDAISDAICVLGDLSLAPGESTLIHWEFLEGGADGEFAIYNTNSFELADNMEDYMEWGSAGHFREALAVAAGLWIVGEFLPGSQPFTFIGGGSDYGESFWTSVISGCTYPLATNYNALANSDDGSCLYEAPCTGDFNGDLIVNTPDLLTFLSVFGGNCN